MQTNAVYLADIMHGRGYNSLRTIAAYTQLSRNELTHAMLALSRNGNVRRNVNGLYIITGAVNPTRRPGLFAEVI